MRKEGSFREEHAEQNSSTLYPFTTRYTGNEHRVVKQDATISGTGGAALIRAPVSDLSLAKFIHEYGSRERMHIPHRHGSKPAAESMR